MVSLLSDDLEKDRDGLVYSLQRIGTPERYIGSSFQTDHARRADHFEKLRAGRSPHGKLQTAWDTYGEKAFVFEVLKRVDNCSLRALGRLEEFYIEYYDTTRTGYNRRRCVVEIVPAYSAMPNALIPFALVGQSCAGEALMYKHLRLARAGKNQAEVRLVDRVIEQEVDIYDLPDEERKFIWGVRNRERTVRDAVLEWQQQHPLIVEGRQVLFLRSDVQPSDPKYQNYKTRVQSRTKQLLDE